jgi:hypothetical protein
MKQYAVGLTLGLLTLTAMAQEASSEGKGDSATPVTATTVVSASPPALPDGVTTEQNPLKQTYIAKRKGRPLLFRPNPDMPEVVNEALLRELADSGSPPFGASKVSAFVPKLKVLPCAKGCEGKDYDKAVEAFVSAFNRNGALTERGEMLVQVRWFNQRSFLNPVGSDTFGVSFVVEGKLVSLGQGTTLRFKNAKDVAYAVGHRLGRELIFTLGMGMRPRFLVPMDTASVGENLRGALAKANGLIGAENVDSRIEPVTAEHAQLLPAVDGIRPGEIEPISGMRYINAFVY